MTKTQAYHFSLLKQKIAATFLATHAAAEAIETWKGDTITDFREDLRAKTKTGISEKWFYTYIKKEPKKLPRIDMLNLLSVYAGYENWTDFTSKHTVSEEAIPTKKQHLRIVWFALVILLGAIAFGYAVYPKNYSYFFCFMDADQRKAITKTPIDILILHADETQEFLRTDSLGCFTYQTKEEMIKFVVRSPYYKTDTIVRHHDRNTHRNVRLETDDYALMLLYYANGNTKDWKKRRAQLSEIISDDAQIYRVLSGNVGIELYSKEEFINMLTIPTSSLKKLRVLDKVYENEQIVKLKFMIQ